MRWHLAVAWAKGPCIAPPAECGLETRWQLEALAQMPITDDGPAIITQRERRRQQSSTARYYSIIASPARRRQACAAIFIFFRFEKQYPIQRQIDLLYCACMSSGECCVVRVCTLYTHNVWAHDSIGGLQARITYLHQIVFTDHV